MVGDCVQGLQPDNNKQKYGVKRGCFFTPKSEFGDVGTAKRGRLIRGKICNLAHRDRQMPTRIGTTSAL